MKKDFPIIDFELPLIEAYQPQSANFKLGPSSAKGVDALVQLVIKGLLTVPGDNFLVPSFGIGISELKENGPNLRLQITVLISLLERQIKQIQSGNQDKEFLLDSLLVDGIRVEGDTLYIIIRVINQASQEKTIGVAV